jgi:hypothetical protein
MTFTMIAHFKLAQMIRRKYLLTKITYFITIKGYTFVKKIAIVMYFTLIQSNNFMKVIGFQTEMIQKEQKIVGYTF